MGPRYFLGAILGLGALVLVVGSFFVDVQVGLGCMLHPPWPELHRYWLPLFVFLVLVFCWLARRLWHLLDAQPASFEYQDIDAGWNEAMQFLEEFEIDFAATPVFLVLGGDSERLFADSAAHMTSIPLSRRVDFTLHLQARGEAVFISCQGATAVGLQSFTGAAADSPGNAKELAAMQQILAKAQREGRGLDQLTAAEKNSISLAIDDEHEANEDDAEEFTPRQRVRKATARLRHLCRLIVRERQPYCPLNGILVAVPFAASATEQRSDHAAECIQQDLLVARRTLQVDCPVTMLVCNLQETVGAAELLALTSPSSKQQSLGLRFPLLPDLDPHETAAMLENGVHWVCCNLLPRSVYKLMRPLPTQTQPHDTADKLFRLLAEMRTRARRLAKILSRGTELADGAAVMAAGFYLAASGKDTDREHAFVTGVLREMHLNQNYVSWTPETLGRNTRARRLASVGFATMLLLVVSAGLLLRP